MCRRIRDQGGIVYVPHPFDPLRNCLREDVLLELIEAGLVDALEVRNAKTSLESLNRKAHDVALPRPGWPWAAGPTPTSPTRSGAAYSEMPAFDGTPAGFLASLRDGTVIGHHYDAPRRWRPRIVPSTSVS